MFMCVSCFTGGDGPEAVADALNDLLTLSWRATATKICVFISDAPPHGLGGGGDGFPAGIVCPKCVIVNVYIVCQNVLFHVISSSN